MVRAVVPELARELVRLPAGFEVTCAGRSMEPAIQPGQRVRVRAGAVEPGDVFVFETARGELEMHRLVLALPGGWLVHQGDNQQDRGVGFTRAEKVIGRADVTPRPPTWPARGRAAAAVAWRAIGAAWRRRPHWRAP